MVLIVIKIILIGVGTCAIFDVWQRGFAKITGVPPSNWALVGRWCLGFLAGRGLIARELATLPARPNELAAGWALHYGVAIAYAAAYAGLMQVGWLNAGFAGGLMFGVISVIVPWLFFMPALGNGVMARLTPKPVVACALALMMHAVFGVSMGVGFALFAG